ncbi:DUF4268 domain-containing protein [Sunxiuqinia sp. A32]|uniref:DUF4268 domain-containing protein n=1 Tax=Sunxiuqinia sp. A32 TaxID=3461496 RepID=UPI0040465FF4
MSPKIGKLKKVEIRELWKGEASDFTPWLAKEENISQLSEEIQIELEVVQQEKNVGPFRADILCKNTIDDHYVLIENQLERTDHTHLGQIMTYAAGLDAVTVIWIAKQFTEEHRATIDWLNRITDEQFNFFGIEIEAYQIGESLPAPMFQIVSKPNNWSKTVKSAAGSQDLTEAKTLNLEYWTAMKKYFEDNGSFLRNQKPSPNHWTNFALGKSYFHLSVVHSVRDNFLRIEFLIKSDTSKEDFRKLKSKYENQSYQEIDENVIWDELPDNKLSWVYLKRDANVSDKSDWKNQHQWFMDNIEKFDKFFRPKIKQL